MTIVIACVALVVQIVAFAAVVRFVHSASWDAGYKAAEEDHNRSVKR